MGRGAPRRARCRGQSPDGGRGSRPDRQAQLEDPRQRTGRATPRPVPERSGGNYPQVAVPGARAAAALAAAADDSGGHGPGPDRRRADFRGRLRLDLRRRGPPPHHARPARQDPLRPPADALARLGHRRPRRRRQRRPAPRSNAATSTAWNAPTGCPLPGARPSAGTAAAPATWTTSTKTTASAPNSMDSRLTRPKAAGAIPTVTTPTSSRERRPCATAGLMSPGTAARPPPRLARSSEPAAGRAPSGPAAPHAPPPSRPPIIVGQKTA